MNENFDHDLYQIKPKHRALSQHITINDALANRILSGVVVIKSDIERFTEDGIIFQGKFLFLLFVFRFTITNFFFIKCNL